MSLHGDSVFQIVHNQGEKSNFCRLQGGAIAPLSWIRPQSSFDNMAPIPAPASVGFRTLTFSFGLLCLKLNGELNISISSAQN